MFTRCYSILLLRHRPWRSIVAIIWFILVVCSMNGIGWAREPTIGVLTIHGVGSQRPAMAFDRTLRAELERQRGQEVRVVVKSVYFHGESISNQSALWRQFDRLEDDDHKLLDQKLLRYLMLTTVSDALAYGSKPDAPDSFYYATHQLLRDAVDALSQEVTVDDPVVIVAHSLGCKIVFDYLCDSSTGDGIWKGKPDPTEAQKLKNMMLFVTMGCNLPFFESALPAEKSRFFPDRAELRWVNYYDRDDLLGWPLRPLGGEFAKRVDDQERGKLGSLLTCHTQYWRDEEFNRELAREILKVAKPTND